jgi:hypothetical protein
MPLGEIFDRRNKAARLTALSIHTKPVYDLVPSPSGVRVVALEIRQPTFKPTGIEVTNSALLNVPLE